MNPLEIKTKADVIAYIQRYLERFGHLPAAVCVPHDAYLTISREMHAQQDKLFHLRLYINDVLIVDVDR